MKRGPLSLDERESCITWTRGEDLADAWLYSNRLIGAVKRLGVRGERVAGGATHYRFPIARLKLRLPRKARGPKVESPDLTGFTAGEEELAVTFNEAGREAVVYTTSGKWARALCRQGVPWQRDGWGVRFTIPREAVKVFPPRRMTAAQMANLAGQRRGAVVEQGSLAL